ncbi:MAG TPA: hypothetical protein VEJ84_05165 [Acidimicrobiales bacterium]|nr:hypothetical protein [Acidimicrobiales bacterium]
MATKGKAQLLITFVATPDQVEKIDSLVASHGAWMEKTHYRDGPKALLSYNFSKGPELANALDPGSSATGNTRYVLNEIYESPAGIEDHWQQAQQSWDDFAAIVEIISKSNPHSLHCGVIAQSLW